MTSEIRLYQWNKELNSSILPTNATPSIVSGDFTLPVDITAPVATFLTSPGYISDLLKYNYAYIPLFDRYYFVTDKTIDTSTRIVFNFAEDCLASFRSSLTNVNGFLLYSSFKGYPEPADHVYPDGTITDSRVVPKYIYSTQHFATSTKFVNNLGAGCFVVTVASTSLTTAVPIPTPNQVVCSFSEFQSWYAACQACYENNALDSMNTTTPVTDFFTDVKWYPIPKSLIVDSDNSVNITYSPFPGAGISRVVTRTLDKVKTVEDWTFYIEYDTHVDAGTPSPYHPTSYIPTFLNREPYTKRSLVMYPFGEIALTVDCTFLPDSWARTEDRYYLRGHMYLDCLTGSLMGVFETVYGYMDDNEVFHQEPYTANTESATVAYASIAYRLDLTARILPGNTISQIVSGSVSAIQGVASAASSVADAAGGGNPIDAIGGIAGGLGQAATGVMSVIGTIQSRAGTTSVRSGGGNLAGLNLLPYIRSYFTAVSFPKYESEGYPYFKEGKLRSGHFNQMRDGDSAIGLNQLRTNTSLYNATTAERRVIIQYLEGGMHYE